MQDSKLRWCIDFVNNSKELQNMSNHTIADFLSKFGYKKQQETTEFQSLFVSEEEARIMHLIAGAAAMYNIMNQKNSKKQKGGNVEATEINETLDDGRVKKGYSINLDYDNFTDQERSKAINLNLSDSNAEASFYFEKDQVYKNENDECVDENGILLEGNELKECKEKIVESEKFNDMLKQELDQIIDQFVTFTNTVIEKCKVKYETRLAALKDLNERLEKYYKIENKKEIFIYTCNKETEKDLRGMKRKLVELLKKLKFSMKYKYDCTEIDEQIKLLREKIDKVELEKREITKVTQNNELVTEVTRDSHFGIKKVEQFDKDGNVTETKYAVPKFDDNGKFVIEDGKVVYEEPKSMSEEGYKRAVEQINEIYEANKNEIDTAMLEANVKDDKFKGHIDKMRIEDSNGNVTWRPAIKDGKPVNIDKEDEECKKVTKISGQQEEKDDEKKEEEDDDEEEGDEEDKEEEDDESTQPTPQPTQPTQPILQPTQPIPQSTPQPTQPPTPQSTPSQTRPVPPIPEGSKPIPSTSQVTKPLPSTPKPEEKPDEEPEEEPETTPELESSPPSVSPAVGEIEESQESESPPSVSPAVGEIEESQESESPPSVSPAVGEIEESQESESPPSVSPAVGNLDEIEKNITNLVQEINESSQDKSMSSVQSEITESENQESENKSDSDIQPEITESSNDQELENISDKDLLNLIEKRQEEINEIKIQGGSDKLTKDSSNSNILQEIFKFQGKYKKNLLLCQKEISNEQKLSDIKKAKDTNEKTMIELINYIKFFVNRNKEANTHKTYEKSVLNNMENIEKLINQIQNICKKPKISEDVNIAKINNQNQIMIQDITNFINIFNPEGNIQDILNRRIGSDSDHYLWETIKIQSQPPDYSSLTNELEEKNLNIQNLNQLAEELNTAQAQPGLTSAISKLQILSSYYQKLITDYQNYIDVKKESESKFYGRSNEKVSIYRHMNRAIMNNYKRIIDDVLIKWKEYFNFNMNIKESDAKIINFSKIELSLYNYNNEDVNKLGENNYSLNDIERIVVPENIKEKIININQTIFNNLDDEVKQSEYLKKYYISVCLFMKYRWNIIQLYNILTQMIPKTNVYQSVYLWDTESISVGGYFPRNIQLSHGSDINLSGNKYKISKGNENETIHVLKYVLTNIFEMLDQYDLLMVKPVNLYCRINDKQRKECLYENRCNPDDFILFSDMTDFEGNILNDEMTINKEMKNYLLIHNKEGPGILKITDVEGHIYYEVVFKQNINRRKSILENNGFTVETIDSSNTGECSEIIVKNKKQRFNDVFYNPSFTNDIISRYMLLDTSLKYGKDLYLITYGYSGVGKSYTLFGKSDTPGILQSTLNNIKNNVRSITLTIQDIYGYGTQYSNSWDNVKTIQKYIPLTIDNDTNSYKLQLQFNDEVTKKEISIKNLDLLDKFTTTIQSIDEKRKETGRIKKTVNNDVSSRSKIVYKFEFTLNNRPDPVKLVIDDSPGAEDIEKSFIKKPIEKGIYNVPTDYHKCLLYAAFINPLYLALLDPVAIIEWYQWYHKNNQFGGVDEISPDVSNLRSETNGVEYFYMNNNISYKDVFINRYSNPTYNFKNQDDEIEIPTQQPIRLMLKYDGSQTKEYVSVEQMNMLHALHLINKVIEQSIDGSYDPLFSLLTEILDKHHILNHDSLRNNIDELNDGLKTLQGVGGSLEGEITELINENEENLNIINENRKLIETNPKYIQLYKEICNIYPDRGHDIIKEGNVGNMYIQKDTANKNYKNLLNKFGKNIENETEKANFRNIVKNVIDNELKLRTAKRIKHSGKSDHQHISIHDICNDETIKKFLKEYASQEYNKIIKESQEKIKQNNDKINLRINEILSKNSELNRSLKKQKEQLGKRAFVPNIEGYNQKTYREKIRDYIEMAYEAWFINQNILGLMKLSADKSGLPKVNGSETFYKKLLPTQDEDITSLNSIYDKVEQHIKNAYGRVNGKIKLTKSGKNFNNYIEEISKLCEYSKYFYNQKGQGNNIYERDVPFIKDIMQDDADIKNFKIFYVVQNNDTQMKCEGQLELYNNIQQFVNIVVDLP